MNGHRDIGKFALIICMVIRNWDSPLVLAVKSLLGCSLALRVTEVLMHLHCRLAQLLFILSAADINREL